MDTLGEGTQGPFTITLSVATTQFVCHLFDKSRNLIVGKFSYPARTGYETATQSGNAYVITLQPEMTKGMANQVLRADMWAKISATHKPTFTKSLIVVEGLTTSEIVEV